MSSSEPSAAISAADWVALRDICARIEAKCRADRIDDIPDEIATTLLTTATMLFRLATLEHRRSIAAFDETRAIPATSVVVTVSAMLRAAGMNSFDLAMWFHRPPDGGAPVA
jgi:hypothetical protein